jgi:ABC-type uncharacterized transport system substrate-binding protein
MRVSTYCRNRCLRHNWPGACARRSIAKSEYYYPVDWASRHCKTCEVQFGNPGTRLEFLINLEMAKTWSARRLAMRMSCHEDGMAMRIPVTVFVVGLSLLATSAPLEAQKAPGMSRVGWLEVCGPGPRRPHFDIFRARLAEQGYVVGKNLIIEQRFADCRYDRMPSLAAELVQVPVDVLFTMGTRAARVVAGTVKTTPLVVYSCDPFEHVTRLARPGGNLTGVTCITTELSPKRLELLKEAIPKVSRVMFLHDLEAAPNALRMTQEVAPRLGVTLQEAKVGAAEDLLPELTAVQKEQADALFIYPDVVLSSYPRPQ